MQEMMRWAAGLVTHPLDLLAFDIVDQPIMEHAFGGMLIAADAQTAAELATRHSLASVTLDGRISRPGSLQGGWQGSLPNRQTASSFGDLSNIRVVSYSQIHATVARALAEQPLHLFALKHVSQLLPAQDIILFRCAPWLPTRCERP